MLLTVYAAIAAIWAPYPYAALKLVGNMIGILGSIMVLEQAARRNVLDTRTILILMLCSLTLAGVQTFYFGGTNYGFDGPDQPSRFSSFIVAQQFAAYLVCFITLVLWLREIPFWMRTLTGALLVGALALNGSRVWFFGAVIVVVAWFLTERLRLSLLLACAILACLSSYFLFQAFRPYEAALIDESSNRIIVTLRAIVTGVDSSQRVGLRDLTFRTEIYQGVVNDLYASSTSQLLFGHGTSSGAESVLRVFPNNYNAERLDPNRIVHNEWLRASYEWGLVGLLALVAVFVSLALGLNSFRQNPHHRARATAALSFLGAFLLAFSGENVLAGAGNAVSMSLALILALVWAPPRTFVMPSAL
jgi:hypothetical protein